MTEIGFVSLLVAGFGVLAGALVYLAVRFNGTGSEAAHDGHGDDLRSSQ